jgi:hypothetical protein
MATSDWAEMLIADAVSDDGTTREIRLREMTPRFDGRSYGEQVRSDVLRAVARGRLVAGPAELRCPSYHLAWSGPSEEAQAARTRRCPMCSAPGDRFRLEETFFVPAAVARGVIVRRSLVEARV